MIDDPDDIKAWAPAKWVAHQHEDDGQLVTVLQVEFANQHAMTIIAGAEGPRVTLWRGAGEQPLQDLSAGEFRAWLLDAADDTDAIETSKLQ